VHYLFRDPRLSARALRFKLHFLSISAALGQTFDAKADVQYEVARTQREEAAKTEVLGHKLKAKADAKYEIAKVRREGADDSETTGNELETKAVEIETELDREKKKSP
jgi:hypothetical protein